MIYEGKEYVDVTGNIDETGKKGDLIHVTEVNGEVCDVWCFTTNSNSFIPSVNVVLSDGNDCLDIDVDIFTRYRYVKDIEGTPVKFKSGDRVKIVGYGGSSRKITNGRVGKFMYINDLGKCSVLLDGGAQLSFKPETLKLVEETPAPKEKNIPLTDSLRYSAFNTPAYKLKRSINKLYEEMSELITAKNDNYGDSFSKQYKKYGMVSVEMRLNDKFMRLEQLVKGEKDKVGESVEDTLKDIIGYATLALIELEGEK
ncbi:hypothetical protein BtpYZU02_23 [Brochothrix phage BtpYZU02]|nr:hypothetical protein BtpYZU02_23 [Brochothrix phage BtpYZU02]